MPSQAALRTFLFMGLGLLVLRSSSAAGQPVQLNPPVVSWGPNRLDFFAVDAGQGHLWHKGFDGVAWQTAWDDRGAPEQAMPGSVSVVSWGPNRLDVFMGGGEYQHVWHTAWNGSSWQLWDSRGSPPNGASVSPAVVAWGPNRLDLFTLSTTMEPGSVDDNCWHDSWNGSVWETTWDDRGGPPAGFQFYRAATSWGPNRLDVFGFGLDQGSLALLSTLLDSIDHHTALERLHPLQETPEGSRPHARP